MSGSPGTGGSNPRKFSEKIALHNQKQAEETRAFEQLMTDLTVSRVQFQKVQQLRLTQSRAQYYGSLPNVNQIGNTSTEFQGGFPSGLDSVRGTRHHGLVERVHRDRNRINSPHRRPLSVRSRLPVPPLDNNWRREQQPWTEEKRPGFRLISQLNRTNSDSALHTSAMNPNPQDPFGMNQQMGRGPSLRNGWNAASVIEAEVDSSGNVFSFPTLSNEENLIGVSKPLPKQLWEAKKVQSLSSRPKSCEVPGINIFPSPEQNPGLSQYQGLLNTGGSLPDLSNLHFASPLSTPLDPEDNGGYPNLSGGSSTGNLPAAMMHLGIGNSQGVPQQLPAAVVAQQSLHQFVLAHVQQLPRRRTAPISPLTLSPGTEQRRGLAKQLSPTMSPSLSPITQLNNMSAFFNDPFMEQQFNRHTKSNPYQFDQFSLLESAMSSTAGGSCFDPSSSLLYYSQAALSGLGGSHGSLQDPMHMRSNMLYSNCSGGCPTSSSLCDSVSHGKRNCFPDCRNRSPTVVCFSLSDDSSLSKDISSALSTVPECFDSEGCFPLNDELRIEPLGLDGLSMLSDPDMVLPDPSVEDTFRSDRL
ncbi:hypothetical protein F7725_026701 [Dissostichus mawsoni]|uniref:CREB regulated transcription coactivator 3 n=1 Tax=Dissostichus mawsoni TaxID=36200 RepID=A0A7J5X7R8_DISMA|nr:hypothetical protein F7725_026701 [Dissostichus mawsoni]